MVIIGFGGHSRVVLAALRAQGRTVVAATSLEPERGQDSELGVEVLTDEQLPTRFASDQIDLVLGLGAVSPELPTGHRSQIVARFREAGYRFTGLQHPTAWVAPSVQLADTAQIHAGAVVQPGAVVGDFTIVNTRASLDHDCHVGNFCHLAPGVTLSGNVTVEDRVHIGTGAVVIQGIQLGERCLIAAGATVVSDVPAGIWVRGTPARSWRDCDT